jgi:exopolyphosphatase/pppGpp-phosphohydrolase
METIDFFRSLNVRQTSQLKSAFNLAENCNYPKKHTLQVAYLSLLLFSELEILHKLGDLERFWLLSAAILHDIGIWSEGGRAHHKTTLKMILNAQIIQFNHKERLIIGSIARYHRKALPSDQHDHFSVLSEKEKNIVSILSAILRIADGLDVSHTAQISDLKCRINKKKITILCKKHKPRLELEKQAGLEKSDLMQKCFQRTVNIKFHK